MALPRSIGEIPSAGSPKVSTAEVALTIGQYPGIAEANVYGVLVPNHEGAQVVRPVHLDPNHVGPAVDYNELLSTPELACLGTGSCVFALVKASTHIHNHKQNKVPLRKEGWTPRHRNRNHPTERRSVLVAPGLRVMSTCLSRPRTGTAGQWAGQIMIILERAVFLDIPCKIQDQHIIDAYSEHESIHRALLRLTSNQSHDLAALPLVFPLPPVSA